MERSDGIDFNSFIGRSSSSVLDSDALYDASQYAFFGGKGIVDEVELGDLDDQDAGVPTIGCIFSGEDELNEYLCLTRMRYAIVEELASFGAVIYTCARDQVILDECLAKCKRKGYQEEGSV